LPLEAGWPLCAGLILMVGGGLSLHDPRVGGWEEILRSVIGQ
jgi:hypothetical protein